MSRSVARDPFAMTEELPESYSLMCSGCHTPCSGTDAHVIPRWNPAMGKVLTTYRCSNCWVASLDELRGQVVSGAPEVRASFWDFLARHGFSRDADTMRGGPAEEQEATLLLIIDAVQTGRLVLDP